MVEEDLLRETFDSKAQSPKNQKRNVNIGENLLSKD
jgi:hypothetical protein